MKTIYLPVLGEGWVSFQYTNISELEEEFAQRGIEVGDGCELGNYCKLGNGCKLGNDCKLIYDCKLGYGCELSDGCKLGECCELGDGCKVPKSLFISASQHSVSYWGYDAIQIGCKKHTISEWQKHFREIGKAEGYSEEQIDEYGSYIDLIAKLHGRWNVKQK
jgi:NDP-sugar pyrophosphorylase family protein